MLRPMTASEPFSVYTLLRLVHNQWRWVVVATALLVLVRAIRGAATRRDWQRGDNLASVAFLGALDLQLLIGLVLYFFYSPYFQALLQAPKAAMHDAVTRFYAVEHQTAMLLVVVVAHIGRVRSRRLPAAGPARHWVMLWTMAIFFVLTLWAIPWPWRTVARPLFRLSW